MTTTDTPAKLVVSGLSRADLERLCVHLEAHADALVALNNELLARLVPEPTTSNAVRDRLNEWSRGVGVLVTASSEWVRDLFASRH